MNTLIRRAAVSALFAVLISSCSTVMEYNRPDPVSLDKFVVGERRLNVVGELGAPLASEKDAENSCDVYKLYTRGPGGAGKGAIAATEAVADVLTLGLAEVVATPVEAGTKNALHTVIFCYSPDSKLVSMHEDGQPLRELAQDKHEREAAEAAAAAQASAQTAAGPPPTDAKPAESPAAKSVKHKKKKAEPTNPTPQIATSDQPAAAPPQQAQAAAGPSSPNP